MKKIATVAGLIASIGTSAPANAQFAVRMACYSDMQKLCTAEFKERDREKMRLCLRTNLSKASEPCQQAVREQMAANKRD